MSTTFDTLKYAKRLKEAGFTESQAEAQAQALGEALQQSGQGIATKLDIAELKTEIAVLDARLRMIERVLWGIVLGVAALLIRAYVLPA